MDRSIPPHNPKLFPSLASEGVEKIDQVNISEHIEQDLEDSIQFFREFFGNGSHLAGLCGPLSELLYNSLTSKSDNVTVNCYQLGITFPENEQRHVVLIAKEKDNPNHVYLIDSTVQQFDHSVPNPPGDPHPVKPSEDYSLEVNNAINNLREKGFTKITPEFAEIYSGFFHSPSLHWTDLAGSIEPQNIRSTSALIDRIGTNPKFKRYFIDPEKTPQDWLNAANDRFNR